VIAGSARGLRLVAPGSGTRPLGDRVKQALFAILEPEIRGRPFLDLFAGSGAGGIEALSRGASLAVFVEHDPKAIDAIRRNLLGTGLAGDRAEIVGGRVGRWLSATRQHGHGPFAAILVDPPYEEPVALAKALEGIADAGPESILAEDGVVVAKHFWKTPPPAEIGLLRSVRERRFGETSLTFLRWIEEEDG
jgi:16S rRNA (guanine966-N2)-methyltransferase